MAKTVKIVNVSPRGDLDVPLLGSVVKAGEQVTVSEEFAKQLLAQTENFVAAPGHSAGSEDPS
ncbi:hypothetical protein [Paeniglutamicibacter sp.]|uniref:hypothetical protein n=1 Tax=Paeniglutamicibacter sp. TaxID=1934391 RepID=UPI003989174B